jgi:hypothetical protein
MFLITVGYKYVIAQSVLHNAIHTQNKFRAMWKKKQMAVNAVLFLLYLHIALYIALYIQMFDYKILL